MADNFNISDVPEGVGPKSVEVPGDIADGTDGELMTWDAAGVASLVPTGAATEVLTSNGAGTSPTFQAGGGGAVTSVFGRIGAVIAVAADYSFALIAGTISAAQHAAQTDGTLHADVVAAGADGFMTGTDKTKLDGISAGAEVNAVDSVFGRTGAVVAADDDYKATQLADEVDGSILTWSAAGEAVLVGPGTAAQVLTSNGAGAAPSFQAGGDGGGATETAEVTATVDQLVANNTNFILAFAAETFDNDSMHDNATNNSRLTINTAGKWLFGFNGRWESDASGFRQVSLKKNGTTLVSRQMTQNTGSGNDLNQCVTFVLQDAIVTDFFEIEVIQNSGGGLDMEFSGPAVPPTFWAHRLS